MFYARRSTVTVAAVLALAACEESTTSTAIDQQQPAPAMSVEGFANPSPVRTGWIIGRNGRPMQIAYQIQEGSAIWEGDIDLGPAEWIAPTAQAAVEQAQKRGEGPDYGVVIDGAARRWPNAVVPYVIDKSLRNQSRVTDAIAHITANTNRVTFVPRTNQANYVRFTKSTGCSSSVGMVGGVQYIRLADGCTTGNTIHEINHALGLFHEHTRCDRDSYVVIHWENIQAGYEHNFDLQCTNASDIDVYNEGSIMHYPSVSFSKNGQPTITSLRGRESEMGQRTAMAGTDIRTVDAIYP